MAENLKKQENTKKKIKDAVMQLWAEKGFYKITVTAAARLAGLHRSTFYVYYESIDDVIKDVEQELLEKMNAYSSIALHSNKNLPANAAPEDIMAFTHSLLHDYYSWMFSMRDYFNPLLNEGGDLCFLTRYEEHIRNTYLHLLKELHLNLDDGYELSYIVGGTFRTNVEWLKKGTDSIDDIIRFQMKMFLGNRS